MTIDFDLTTEICNTQYAPLAALIVHYHRQKMLYPLSEVEIPIKSYEY